jgi:hypothetical protein
MVSLAIRLGKPNGQLGSLEKRRIHKSPVQPKCNILGFLVRSAAPFVWRNQVYLLQAGSVNRLSYNGNKVKTEIPNNSKHTDTIHSNQPKLQRATFLKFSAPFKKKRVRYRKVGSMCQADLASTSDCSQMSDPGRFFEPAWDHHCI